MQLDDAFVQQLRDFLSNLYDYGYLQSSPLVTALSSEGQDAVQRMRSVRSLVLRAIEQLHPGPGVSFRSPRARAHSILNLHYVEGLSVQEVAVEMSTSERTLYRELRKAEQDLAVALWSLRQEQAVRPAGLVLAEAERIGSGPEEVAVRSLLEGALAAVHRLSRRRQVELDTSPAECPLSVRTDRLLARQALISVLSHAIQNARPETHVTVRVQAVGARVEFAVSYLPKELHGATGVFPAAAQQLIQQLGGRWTMEPIRAAAATLAFTLGSDRQCVVLVIDDNANLLELFQRYLADEGYALLGAANGLEGLHLAERIRPDVVILNVMMPQNDGWEVLQWFQTRPSTRSIPVIVCSVLNDPELAFSLGAAAFLAKPVQREPLLKVLAPFRQGTPPPSDPAGPADT